MQSDLVAYSAVCAWAEPDRKERDRKVREGMLPLTYQYLKLTKGQNYNDWVTSSLFTKKSREAHHAYLHNVAHKLKDYDLNPRRYNELGQLCMKNHKVRDAVRAQTKMYLDAEKEKASESWRKERGGRSRRARSPAPVEPGELKQFATAVHAMEKARLSIRAQLAAKLEVRKLPRSLCNAESLRLAGSHIKSACAAFPKYSQDIVRKNNLTVEEFNAMLRQTRANPLFRMRVWAAIREVTKEEEMRK